MYFSTSVSFISSKKTLHPGRLTWNLKMMVWKMIFLFNSVIFRFHVNLPGCKNTPLPFFVGHMFLLAPFPEAPLLWQCFRSTRSRRWAAFARRNMARQAPKASKSCCFWLKLEAILRVSSQRFGGVHQLPAFQKQRRCWLKKRGRF